MTTLKDAVFALLQPGNPTPKEELQRVVAEAIANGHPIIKCEPAMPKRTSSEVCR